MIWLPNHLQKDKKPGPGEVRPAGHYDDGDSIPITLCGGPYGETKETGKQINIHKDAKERVVMIAKPRDRMNPFMKDGTVERWTFVPSPEKDVWRPRHGEEVPR